MKNLLRTRAGGSTSTSHNVIGQVNRSEIPHLSGRYPIQRYERPKHRDWEKPRPVDGRPGAALRRSVFERDQNTCQQCGGPGDQIHHVKPWALGGETTQDNLQVICAACHEKLTVQQNSTRLPYDEWIAKIEREYREWLMLNLWRQLREPAEVL